MATKQGGVLVDPRDNETARLKVSFEAVVAAIHASPGISLTALDKELNRQPRNWLGLRSGG